MEWLEITATSVEEAKEQALVHLGVHESDAEVQVVSEGRVGLFGRIKEGARVRARVIPTPVRPKENRNRSHSGRRPGSKRSQARRPSGAADGDRSRSYEDRVERVDTEGQKRPLPAGSSGDSAARMEAGRNRKNDRGKKDDRGKDVESMSETRDPGPSLMEQADMAEQFVEGIGASVGIDLTFVRHDMEHDIMRIEANGEGIGLLVGRRGLTAQAIDDLVRTFLQRCGGSVREGKIRMDIGGMRARRAAALAEFTRSVAVDVVESGGEVVLEPMNRLDRKIVHDVVSEIEDVESRSEGEDPNRRVVIAALD